MFVTKNTYKSRASTLLTEPGADCWVAAELALNVPWFLVEFNQAETIINDEPVMLRRTMIFAQIWDVESLVKSEIKGQLEIKYVFVITPGNVNGGNGWKMERLKAVWMGEEASLPGCYTEEIYETVGGIRYSRYGTSTEELNNQVLRFRMQD